MKSTAPAKKVPRDGQYAGLRFCIAVLALLAGLIPAVALAEDASPSPELPATLLHDAMDAPGSLEEAAITDPLAAKELPHRNLSREEAVELTEEVFDPVLEDAVGPIHGLKVEKYLSEYTAIVSSDAIELAAEFSGGQTFQPNPVALASVLLESTLPLRTEDDAGHRIPIDFSLQVSGDDLTPRASLVPVEIPRELGEGVRLPSVGIDVNLSGAPASRGPSIINETAALYPNIGTDTDYSVVPTPTGFETLTTLRSPDAPTEQRITLTLPEGAALHQAEGGAEVKQEGRTILTVEAPYALDATGANVPVRMEVQANSLVLTTSPPPDAQHPILVDPVFHTYDWYYSQASNEPHQDAWSPSTNAVGMTTYADSYGLHIRARRDFSYVNGSQAAWTYEVPRLKAEQASGRTPTSYIQSMSLWHMGFVTNPGGSFAPYMFAGIHGSQGWSGKPGGYAVWSYAGNGQAFYMNAPGNGANLSLVNGEPGARDKSAKHGLFGVASTENVAPQAGSDRYAGVGGFAVEIGDDDAPLTSKGITTAWVNQTPTVPLTATAEDTGLGVKKIGFDLPFQGDQWITNSCIGGANSPCPLSWTASLPANQYNPAKFPQGLVHVPVDAEDPVGNAAVHGQEHVDVRVDHTAPTLAVSGSITEQAQIGTNAAQYQLNYASSDGDNMPPEALPPFGVAGTGQGKMQRPMGVALDASGNAFVVDRECKCVQKYDPTGKFLSQFGTGGSGNGQFSDPRGIAISSAGDILVSDFVNKNVQVFNASGGFIRKISYGPFVNPYALVAAPGNTFWVSDVATHRVMQFDQNGTFLREAQGAPAAGGPAVPAGLAIDPTGSVWMTDNANARIIKFDANGSYVLQFGSNGTGNGQFKAATGIAVAPSGHILVADGINGRIQVFQSTGSYLRQFGSTGAASNQLNEPRGIAFGPGNSLYIADANNKRIAKWNHADLDLQSGVRKLQIKVGGQIESTPVEQTCTSVCAATGTWSLNADSYSVGTHSVEVVATDGVGLAATKSLTIETHGDLTPPTIALSGPMTEQASLGNTRPSYKLKVQASDPGASNERKSGVASVAIKVDGVTKDTTAPGCPAGSCAITREWTLNSDSYSVGSHNVQVVATDAAGRTSTKSLSLIIERDKTPPQISATNTLFTALEGWVEQATYNYSPTAIDDNGYGLASFVFKIDGNVVKSKALSCPAGACGATLSGAIDMAAYTGGAHPAELVATDGAGNVAKKTWSINVDPAGAVTVGEATDTLEAVEETAEESQPVASTSEFLEPGIIEAGDNPHFNADSDSIDSAGVPTNTSIDLDTGAVTIDGADGPLVVTPASEGQSSTTKIEAGVAAVTPNVRSGVDRVVRPEYNGALFFTDIRSPTSLETFSWNVQLDEGQTLNLAGDQHAEIFAEDGFRKSLISAMPAHDATGKEVSTHITVDGATVTLVVEHKDKGFVYPVVAGQSFEVGYSSVIFELPTEAEELEDEGTPFNNPFPLTIGDGLTSGEVKRLTARGRQANRIVPSPSAGASKVRYFEVDEERCHPDTCDAWQVREYGATFVRHTESVEWLNGTEINCDGDIEFPFTLSTTIDIVDTGFVGPWGVKKGSEKKLITYCRFVLDVWVVPDNPDKIPGVPSTTKGLSLLVWVYPNGYQTSYLRRFEYDDPIVEN